MLDGRRFSGAKGDPLKKQIIAKYLFICVYIVDAISFIYNNFGIYFINASEDYSPLQFIIILLLKCIPFIGFILLLNYIRKNENIEAIIKIKTCFFVYILLDLLSGFSYYIEPQTNIIYFLFPFYSHNWMFYIIFSIKYYLNPLLLPLLLNILVWIGYFLIFSIIKEKIKITDRDICDKENKENRKLFSISFIIGIINSIILLTALISLCLTLFKPYVYDSGLPLYQSIIFVILLIFFPYSILVTILSIIGIIIGRNEKIGKQINTIPLLISIVIILSYILYINIFVINKFV